MTILEAIKRCLDMAKYSLERKLAEEHRQLAEWLTELDERQKNDLEQAKGCPFCNEGCDLVYKDSIEPTLYIRGDTLVALRYDEADSMAYIQFCPICGRKLKEG